MLRKDINAQLDAQVGATWTGILSAGQTRRLFKKERIPPGQVGCLRKKERNKQTSPHQNKQRYSTWTSRLFKKERKKYPYI